MVPRTDSNRGPIDYKSKRFKIFPFITKLPLKEYDGYMVMCFDPNNSAENYYEDGEGEKHKLTDEILDRQIYDGTSKKKETKPLLRIVE